MRSDERFNQEIQRAAERMRQQMEGGYLFGRPIDVTNIDHVLAVAYHACEKSRLEGSIEARAELRNLYARTNFRI